VSFTEDDLRQAVYEGVAHMRAHRRPEQKLAEAAREYPEMTTKDMLVFAISAPRFLEDVLLFVALDNGIQNRLSQSQLGADPDTDGGTIRQYKGAWK
jgi:hypothetical protein